MTSKLRSHAPQGPRNARAVPDSVRRALDSPGRPLDAGPRHDMERRFGRDFSRVRIHDDAVSAQSARDIRARAYTQGRDVVFDSGTFEPHTLRGRQLLAHELAHVAAQGADPTAPRAVADVDSAGEGHARAAADAAIAGRALPAIAPAPGGLVWREVSASPHYMTPHVPTSPSIRLEGERTVRGFRITPDLCGCEKYLQIAQAHSRKAVQAYTSCAKRGGDHVALYACTARKLYGARKPEPAASADLETGVINMPTEQQWEARQKILGLPTTGPCVPVLKWAVQVHESQHLDDAIAIARSVDSEFGEAYVRLERDPDRMKKLEARYPKQMERFKKITITPWEVKLGTVLQTEMNAHAADQAFLQEVLDALATTCQEDPKPKPAPLAPDPGLTPDRSGRGP